MRHPPSSNRICHSLGAPSVNWMPLPSVNESRSSTLPPIEVSTGCCIVMGVASGVILRRLVSLVSSGDWSISSRNKGICEPEQKACFYIAQYPVHRRGAVVKWLARPLGMPAIRVRAPDQEHGIIWCNNLALYIRDCASLCLSDETVYLCISDETLKSRWFHLSGVSARGSKISHTGGKCVTCCGLHRLA